LGDLRCLLKKFKLEKKFSFATSRLQNEHVTFSGEICRKENPPKIEGSDSTTPATTTSTSTYHGSLSPKIFVSEKNLTLSAKIDTAQKADLSVGFSADSILKGLSPSLDVNLDHGNLEAIKANLKYSNPTFGDYCLSVDAFQRSKSPSVSGCAGLCHNSGGFAAAHTVLLLPGKRRGDVANPFTRFAAEIGYRKSDFHLFAGGKWRASSSSDDGEEKKEQKKITFGFAHSFSKCNLSVGARVVYDLQAASESVATTSTSTSTSSSTGDEDGDNVSQLNFIGVSIAAIERLNKSTTVKARVSTDSTVGISVTSQTGDCSKFTLGTEINTSSGAARWGVSFHLFE